MSEAEPQCANCRAALTGPYCAACGQRVEARVRSLGHFIAETIEAVTHADSRLWRTLTLLLLRPGYLTREFLVGRRARYLPPARLYLVVSVVFFVVLSFAGGGAELVFTAAAPNAFDELERELALTPDAGRREELRRALGELRERVVAENAGAGAAVSERCAVSIPDMPAVAARLASTCETMVADGGRSFVAALADNIPLALVLLLPLLAAVMKLLYLERKRYYVEHLLLLTHNHAAAFLALLLHTMLVRLLPETLRGWLGLLLALYLGWYGYRALRTTYEERRAPTFAKLGALAAAYVVFGVVLLLATIVVSALTL